MLIQSQKRRVLRVLNIKSTPFAALGKNWQSRENNCLRLRSARPNARALYCGRALTHWLEDRRTRGTSFRNVFGVGDTHLGKLDRAAGLSGNEAAQISQTAGQASRQSGS